MQSCRLFELGSKEDFEFEGQALNGVELREQILETMRSTVGAMSYNQLYRTQEAGIATTFAGFSAAAIYTVRFNDRTLEYSLQQVTPGS